MSSINLKMISEILGENRTAEALGHYAATRTRDIRNGISDLPTIRMQISKQQDFLPVPEDLIEAFRRLQEQGVGVLKGNKFKWNIPIKKIGEAVGPKANKVAPRVQEDTPSCPRAKTDGWSKTFVFPEGEVIINGKLTKENLRFISNRLLLDFD